MVVTMNDNKSITVTREGSKKLYKESTFYRKVADVLNTCGFDVIPKEMCKDGHMVDNGRYYVTDRKRKFGWYQADWATYDICRDYYNKDIPVTLIYND